jgi:hypothetical protein
MMAAIRRILRWWENGDAGRAIAMANTPPEDDAEARALEEAHEKLDRRLEGLTLELANQRRQRDAHGKPHRI